MANGKNTFRQAVDLALQGNWPEARKILQRIVEQKNDDDQVWLWLADSYTSDEARLAILQYGLRRHPDSDHLMRALELQLEKMNDAAAVKPAPAEFQAAEPEAEPVNATDFSVEETPLPDTERPEGEPRETHEAISSAEGASEVPSAAAEEEQQAAERWQAEMPLTEGGSDELPLQEISAVEPAPLSEHLSHEMQPEPESQLLPAPETLQTSAPSGGKETMGLRSILISAAIILLVIVLAYLYTRLR